jgi:hypothetical protein
MCRASYNFLTSARSREKSSLLAEEFDFSPFSTASVPRKCADTCRNVKRYRSEVKDNHRPSPCFAEARLRVTDMLTIEEGMVEGFTRCVFRQLAFSSWEQLQCVKASARRALVDDDDRVCVAINAQR